MNSLNISNNEKLKQANSKNDFVNVKSNFILKKVFDIINKNKLLNIVKYNKALQKRLYLTINDYKEYYQSYYSSIEIEVKLDDNKYGKFINIIDENKDNYHIYFNDSSIETERNYLKEKEKVNKIKIIIDYQVKSLKQLFSFCDCISSIIFKKFDRINISDMRGMFYHCSSLKKLDLSNFKTNNVTNMGYMFYYCSSLEELNLSSFNTNNVTDMGYMFAGCTSLKELNLSHFNTNNVKNMRSMFYYCFSLKELNISNFIINSENDTRNMFDRCSYKLEKKATEQLTKKD